QGCPLSPLLFTIIAEVLTQSIVNDDCFKGVVLNGNFQKKVAAFADDTAIACADINDFEQALWHLDRYERATGMLRNVDKTEVVSTDPDIVRAARNIGFYCAKEVK